MDPQRYKVWESRVRRMAERQGLRLVKSRRRDQLAIDYGCYHLTETATDGIVYGSVAGWAVASLEDIEDYLTLTQGPDDEEDGAA